MALSIGEEHNPGHKYLLPDHIDVFHVLTVRTTWNATNSLAGSMQEMLRPIPVALASCTRFFEAMSAMRDSFATLQKLRVGHSSSSAMAPNADSSQRIPGDSDCVTPPWRTESRLEDLASRSPANSEVDQREGDDENSEVGENNQVDGISHRRLSWPPSVKQNGL